MENRDALLGVLKQHAVPDPKLVGKLPKGGIQLDFVGHADITRILIEIDPCWDWRPVAWEDGRPTVHVENGIATMWGELTLLGHSRLGVGSCRADKADLDKELVSDFLRNAAMRFGIALSLWTKQEWEDLNNFAGKPAVSVAHDPPWSKDALQKFIQACADANLDHDQVADRAGVVLTQASSSDMKKLRVAFKEMSGK
jgi:hypothetical protein